MDANISLEAQIFVLALAREGTFSRAAKKLHITQPALTRKIGALEKQLGLKLEKSKTQLDVIVIDHMDKQPAEN